MLPQDSAILTLLRHVRDEAHRFAIGHYRKLHKKQMQWSELSGIRGVGPRRRMALLKKFKTVAAIRVLTAEELSGVPGIDLKTAKSIEEYFKTR